MLSKIKRLKSTALFLAGLILFWLVVVFVIASASVPFNPLSMSKSGGAKIARILPEGWGFFTRDPNEPSVLVYKKDQSGELKLITPTATDPSYLLGLSRISRRLNFEVSLCLGKIQDSVWEKVEKPTRMNLNTQHCDTIQNKLANPLLMGDYVFVRQDRVPWAWTNVTPIPLMPYKMVNIHIKS
jgi:antimicrobial peptide system SdpA family protein